MSLLLEIALIFLVIGIFLKLQDKSKQKDSRIITEEEKNNTVKKLSNCDIENNYFNMMVGIYLKKKFPDIITWEWEHGGEETLHYLFATNGVLITKLNGVQQYVFVITKEVWGTKAKKTVIKDSPVSQSSLQKKEEKNNSISLVIDYLKEHGTKIEEAVKTAMDTGAGFYAHYLVEKNLATDEFMTILSQELEKNTNYDVSFQENMLEICFQDLI